MADRTPVVLIGASAGGVTALRTLAAGLPPGLRAAILVVLHVGHHRSRLPSLLASAGRLSAAHAVDREPLRPGHFHVAPPNWHMLVDGGAIRLKHGPKEHHTRPAIDPLFRSAALSHGPRCIGVVLTGRLDDGTAGLQAIKQCGGVAVVQDPADAEEPSMPASALDHVEVDHCVALARIPALLASLVDDRARPVSPLAPPEPLAREHAISLSKGNPMEHLHSIGKPSTFVCPDCQGCLWELDGTRPVRYRCYTGHAFSLRSLQHAQAEKADDALAAAIRALEEQRLLLERMAADPGQPADTARLRGAAEEAQQRADQLKDLLSAR